MLIAIGQGYFTWNASRSGEMSWSSRDLVTRDRRPRLFQALLVGRVVGVGLTIFAAAAVALGWLPTSN
jgi:ABC-type enterobactin transport system permease subunit